MVVESSELKTCCRERNVWCDTGKESSCAFSVQRRVTELCEAGRVEVFGFRTAVLLPCFLTTGMMLRAD